MYERYKQVIDELAEKQNNRVLPAAFPRGIVNLSSNDYLGIAGRDDVKQSFMNEYPAVNYRFTSSSSRLLTGNSAEYELLETSMARAFGREACLVFNSGYHANIGILPAVTTKSDLIIADKLVHASLIDGIRLSHAEFKRFNHMDFDHLETLIASNRDLFQNIVVVVESIYSMDGDVTNLRELVALREKYGVMLYVDEAHAIGVRGSRGLGVAEEQQCIGAVDFLVGTFGKALASQGAYLVCDDVIKQFLVNTSRSLIFTTALPPLNLAWTRHVVEHCLSMTDEREKLQELSDQLGSLLGVKASSHIIPHVLGENDRAVAFSKKLRDEGFLVLPIRHPTVPQGTARLRFSLQASLQAADLGRMVKVMNEDVV